jgi:hypothetical protein
MIGTLVIGLIIFALSAVFSLGYEGDEAPGPYCFRRCEGRRWKELFPGVPKDEIRRFLSIFVTSFGFRERDRLKFCPDDRVIDVYNAICRPMPSMDDMEMEEFFIRLEDTYGVDVGNGCKTNTTLGMLFRMAIEGKR